MKIAKELNITQYAVKRSYYLVPEEGQCGYPLWWRHRFCERHRGHRLSVAVLRGSYRHWPAAQETGEG